MIDTRTLTRHANLVNLVQRRVKLRRIGKDWVGLCPFHSDKSPSFNVIPGKFMYYCHGCGATGDAIAWLQEMDGLSFIDACKALGAQFDEEGAEIKKVKFPEPLHEPITNWGGQQQMRLDRNILIVEQEPRRYWAERARSVIDLIWWPYPTITPDRMFLAPLIDHKIRFGNKADWRNAKLLELIKTWMRHRKNIQARNKL